MLVEFFIDSNGYVTSYRTGWQANMPICLCLRLPKIPLFGFIAKIVRTCNGGLHPPNPFYTYDIKPEEERLLKQYVLCRGGIKIVNGRGKYDLHLGENLYLYSEDYQNVENLKKTTGTIAPPKLFY